jgi:hypothetical protein
MRKAVLAFCLVPLVFSWARADEATVVQQLKLLNQVPEEELNDKTDPGLSILRTLYDKDGPDFLTLRRLLGKADIRKHLNPSARCVLAGVISQRWDTFSLSGNLYLSGLQSKNPELRDKARKKLVNFIQTPQIPALIELLKIPGPNVLAYEILQQATGMPIDPSVKSWQKWWKNGGARSDIVGHLLNVTRLRLRSYHVRAFDQERFWYLPEGVADAQAPYAKRPEREQTLISDWNNWVGSDVKNYVDDWSGIKDVLDIIVHQPDPRVSKYLETLVADPGYGDYASVVLAWRSSKPSLPAMIAVSKSQLTVGRALARGSLGDRAALVDLLRIMEKHKAQPLSYKIMDDDARGYLTPLRTVGVIPAEQAFELLCHRNFDFNSAYTPKEKKKAFKAAQSWLKQNATRLALDPRRGYYTVSSDK